MTDASISERHSADTPGYSARPLVQRSRIYNWLPQLPRAFLHIAHMRAKARFLHKLQKTYRMETVSTCPICSGTKALLLATQERHGLPTSVVLCRDCGMAYNNFRMSEAASADHYSEDYNDIQRGRPSDIHEFMFALQQEKWPRVRATLEQARADLSSIERLADVGSGEGGLVAACDLDCEKTGFELNTAAVTYAQNRKLNVIRDILSKEHGPFDLIIYEQVLQLVPDPENEISVAAKCQPIGGLLYVGVPGLHDFDQHYDHNLLAYLQYSHNSHFTLHTLSTLMARNGYQLLHGNEKINAVYRKSANAPVENVTPVTPPEKIVDFITEQEALFSEWTHWRRAYKSYAAYILLSVIYVLSSLFYRPSQPGR